VGVEMQPDAVRSGGSVDLPAGPSTVITAGGRRPLASLREVWQYRELLYFLVWRDLKVRYKQTVLGAFWAVLQPLASAVIFTVVFGMLVKVPSEGVPYPLFAYLGLLPWQLFAFALTESTSSVVVHERLLKKVYFPRLYLPLTPVLGAIVDFAVASVVAVALLVAYRVRLGAGLLALPLLIAAVLMCAFAVSVWLAALNVKYRDVRYAVPFLVQVWFFATPIVYSSSVIPAHLRPWWALNPMASIVDGFRWALLGTPLPQPSALLISAGVTLALLAGGLAYFSRVEATIADLV
jgi:lipopolysaccharide transport system permease protein